jgi:cysteine desulfurase
VGGNEMRTGNTIYLDHQATTPVDRRVLGAMLPYFDQSFGNPHSSDHAIGWAAANAVESAAAQVANLVGADSNEIVFTSGATEANNLALLGLARKADGSKRRRILVGAIEHKSVFGPAVAAGEQLGYNVERIPVDREGFVVLPALEGALREDVLAVSVMLVNNEIGTIQPMGDIAAMCSRVGAILHCDGAQAPCALALGNTHEYIDLLSLSAHKMYGPQGVGALVIRQELKGRIEPIIHGGGQQHNLRSGTVATALCVGMGAAAALLNVDEALDEREQLRNRRDRFVERLGRLRWRIRLNGPSGQHRHPGNANLQFQGFLAQDILGTVQPKLAASTGSACTSGVPEPSHVLRAIGLSEDEAESSIRFSLGRFTTDSDVVDAVDLIDGTLNRLSHTRARVSVR